MAAQATQQLQYTKRPPRHPLISEEHEALRRAASDFADQWLAPNAAQMDRERDFLPEVLAETKRLGYYGLNVPQEYGGLGLDSVGMALVAGEIGRGCGATGLSLFAHTVLACEHIRRRGTDAQKQEHLPKFASGEWTGAWGLTEPGGGSDVQAMTTRAEPRSDGGWTLNGQKCFITNGVFAEAVIVNARTPQGFGAFIVRKGTPGFTAERSHQLACMRASHTSSLFFDNCEIGADALLGDPRKGIIDTFACLGLERIIAGGMLTRMARDLLDRSIAYAQERKAFGRPIAQFQSTYRKLAHIDYQAEAADGLWLKAAWLRDQGLPFEREAAMGKLAAATVHRDAAHMAIDVFAGAGLEDATGLERNLRDSLLGSIGGGTTEMMELILARGLGLDVEAGG